MGSSPNGIGTSAGTGAVAGPAGAGRPGIGITPGICPVTGPAGIPGSCGAVSGRCWPPTVVEPSGARSNASGPDLFGAGGPPAPGCTRTATSGGSAGGFGGCGGRGAGGRGFRGGGGGAAA